MDNTREYERKEIGVNVGGSISKVEGFSLVNLSQSGAQIKSLERLKIGNEYLINIALSDAETVSIKSNVVRCTLLGCKENDEGKELPLYEVGLNFIDPDVEVLKKLSVYISTQEHSTKGTD